MWRLPKIHLFDLFYKALRAWPRFYIDITELMSFGQWRKWQSRVFDDLSGKKVLEIGVGPGKLLLEMANKGYVITGIELKKGMADEARRKAKGAGFDIDILHQPVYRMPFKDEIFDCIVITFMLAEIEALDRAILEMKRVLKKNGKAIVIAGGMPQDRNLFARILFKLISAHSALKIERDNVMHFQKHGFKVKRDDFGPFNIVPKILAVKQ